MLVPYTAPWSDPEIKHLLFRCTYGYSKEDIAFYKAKGMSASVDSLFSSYKAPAPPLKDYAEHAHLDPEVPMGSTWVVAKNVADPIQYSRNQSLQRWLFLQMLNDKRSIRHKLTSFWTDAIFATDINQVGVPRWNWNKWSFLYKNCFGSFKTIASYMLTDQAQMQYLNGELNVRTAPDENLSREFMELFTIGKEGGQGYTEADVQAGAKVLTGRNLHKDEDAYSFNYGNHSFGPKLFGKFFDDKVIAPYYKLGNRYVYGKDGKKIIITEKDLLNSQFAPGTFLNAMKQELADYVEMILTKKDEITGKAVARPEVSAYIATRLCRYFCYYEVDETVVKEVAAILAKTWSIKAALQALLKSQYFYSDAVRACRIKSPIEFAVGIFRDLGVTYGKGIDAYKAAYWLYWNCRNMGQGMQEPPNVAGFPAYHQAPMYDEVWINSDTATKRAEFVDGLIEYGRPEDGISVDLLGYVSRLSDPRNMDKVIRETYGNMISVPMSNGFYETCRGLLNEQSNMSYWDSAFGNFAANPGNAIYRDTVLRRLKGFFKFVLNSDEYQIN